MRVTVEHTRTVLYLHLVWVACDDHVFVPDSIATVA
jgi:hypothetical protein